MELYANDNELWLSIRSAKSNKTMFVRPGDDQKISTFRQQAGNVDLYYSTCYYTSPDAAPQRVHGLYFVVAEHYLEPARVSTIEVLYYLSENLGIPEDCIEVVYNGGGQIGARSATNKGDGSDVDGDAENAGYFDEIAGGAGSDGCINGRAITDNNAKDGGPAAEMIIFIQPAVLGSQLFPAVPALNYRLARQLCELAEYTVNIGLKCGHGHDVRVANEKLVADFEYELPRD